MSFGQSFKQVACLLQNDLLLVLLIQLRSPSSSRHSIFHITTILLHYGTVVYDSEGSFPQLIPHNKITHLEVPLPQQAVDTQLQRGKNISIHSSYENPWPYSQVDPAQPHESQDLRPLYLRQSCNNSLELNKAILQVGKQWAGDIQVKAVHHKIVRKNNASDHGIAPSCDLPGWLGRRAQLAQGGVLGRREPGEGVILTERGCSRRRERSHGSQQAEMPALAA